MKKKRALRILSLILLCALTFTACKKNVGTPEDNAASKDENTEEKDKDEQESWKIGFLGLIWRIHIFSHWKVQSKKKWMGRIVN